MDTFLQSYKIPTKKILIKVNWDQAGPRESGEFCSPEFFGPQGGAYMLTILDMGPQSLLYSEARKRGLSDILTNSLIEEFERENWRSPTCFEDLLEVLE